MKCKMFILILIGLLLLSEASFAQKTNPTIPIPKISIDVGTSDSPKDLSVTLQLVLMLTILTLAPSILVMTTAYLRIIIVFHFVRNALGTMQMPPSQLLAGIAMFVTFFIMAPTWGEVNDTAIKPYMDEKISIDSAYTNAIGPIRKFMYKNTKQQDIQLFINLSNMTKPATREDIPTYILIPSFVLSELRTGFIMGFFVYIPFLMVDMIVSSILMSMGMMMLPPMLISLPFKILLFILIDGWNLIIGSLVRSFN
ncbi:MAG: flagellar type III secretion system pore protein FliP [bacterium]